MSRRTSFIAAGALALVVGAAAAFGASAAPASDAQISDQVSARIAQTEPSLANRLQVSTKDGVVTLSGQAGSGLAVIKALQEARHVPGVVKVENHLTVTQ